MGETMKVSRATKKALKAYLSWKALKGVVTVGAASTLAYGLYRYFYGEEEMAA